MPKFLVVIALLLTNCFVSHAAPSTVCWPGWTISSSEELSEGIEYSKNGYTPTFPLSYLFDGDAKTAWVHSAKSKVWDKDTFRSRYAIKLEPKRAITLDGLRLMNGQNASRERFKRNNRVTKVRVTMQSGKEKTVRTFSLPDTMGFHSIALPRRKINSLIIEFVGLKRGVGPDNDVCIAEVQMLNGGRKINMKMPRAVMFYDGLEGCSALHLLRGSTVLDDIAMDMGYSDKWSSDGRYVAGISGGGEGGRGDYLWIADAKRGKIVQKLLKPNFDYEWIGNNRLQLSKFVNEKTVPFKVLTPPFLF